MDKFSDFDFKNHLNVFSVLLNGVHVADVPLGSLEHFLLCVLHPDKGRSVEILLKQEVF